MFSGARLTDTVSDRRFRRGSGGVTITVPNAVSVYGGRQRAPAPGADFVHDEGSYYNVIL
jgi:hypothetical protein